MKKAIEFKERNITILYCENNKIYGARVDTTLPPEDFKRMFDTQMDYIRNIVTLPDDKRKEYLDDK